MGRPQSSWFVWVSLALATACGGVSFKIEEEGAGAAGGSQAGGTGGAPPAAGASSSETGGHVPSFVADGGDDVSSPGETSEAGPDGAGGMDGTGGSTVDAALGDVSDAGAEEARPIDTLIVRGPAIATSERAAQIVFSGSGDPVGFLCQLDGGPWRSCSSPESIVGLADGPHAFLVAAVDELGVADPTPASFAWSVDTVPPVVTIVSPAPFSVPNTNPTLAFTYTVSESATVGCKLDGVDVPGCTATGYTTPTLKAGEHHFEVFATDAAENLGTSSFSWKQACSERTIEVELVPHDEISWSRLAGPLSGGYGLIFDDVGVSLEVTFEGSLLVVGYRSGPDDGAFRVSVDSVELASVQANAPSIDYGSVLTFSEALGPGPHEAVFECTQWQCLIDYIKVCE